jgi:hypothetical protein
MKSLGACLPVQLNQDRIHEPKPVSMVSENLDFGALNIHFQDIDATDREFANQRGNGHSFDVGCLTKHAWPDLQRPLPSGSGESLRTFQAPFRRPQAAPYQFNARTEMAYVLLEEAEVVGVGFHSHQTGVGVAAEKESGGIPNVSTAIEDPTGPRWQLRHTVLLAANNSPERG